MKCHLVVAFFLFASFSCFSQSFSTKSYPVGSEPAQIITADFNGDHIPDIATANSASFTVSILINNGDGTFRPQLEFATGPRPLGLVAVDWNKDGKMDLVVVSAEADPEHKVSILLGNGDGTFQPHQDIPGAPNAVTIAVGDFNHDGNPDIATGENLLGNDVYVSLGNGKAECWRRRSRATLVSTPNRPLITLFVSRKLSWPTSIVTAKMIFTTSSAAAPLQMGRSCWEHSACSLAMATAHLPTALHPDLSFNQTISSRLMSIRMGLPTRSFPSYAARNLCLDAGVFINNGDGLFVEAPVECWHCSPGSGCGRCI